MARERRRELLIEGWSRWWMPACSSRIASSPPRWLHATTLPDESGVSDADEGDRYEATDWSLEHHEPSSVERKLAARDLSSGALALYGLSCNYFEGTQCPLAELGHSREGNTGRLQVNHGGLRAARKGD
jgi:hypothetical protein